MTTDGVTQVHGRAVERAGRDVDEAVQVGAEAGMNSNSSCVLSKTPSLCFMDWLEKPAALARQPAP